MRFQHARLVSAGTLLTSLAFLSIDSVAAQDPDEDRGFGEPIIPDAPPPGRSLLITIGIDDYSAWPKLDNAVGDAKGLARALVDKVGFETPFEPLRDGAATKEAILDLIDNRVRKEVSVDDQVIIFFAGHGTTRTTEIGGQSTETGYLVPVEASAPDEERWSELIRVDRFLDAANELPCRHVLVVLDACNSGLALSGAVEKSRGAENYARELQAKISRRVISSAMADQLASDGGPIPGHSLFTGTLVQGLEWGRTDLDGNGFVTSSEMGLFLQQNVGQATNSRQTPDFGAFGLDDRGELVISLAIQSYDALKARAFSAFDHGRYSEFAELVEQVVAANPDRVETAYLEYLCALSQTRIGDAEAAAFDILEKWDGPGVLPLSRDDALGLSRKLECWRDTLEVPEGPAEGRGLDVRLFTEEGVEISTEALGETSVLSVGTDRVFFRVTNASGARLFAHPFQITAEGQFGPIGMFELSAHVNGIAPGESIDSYILEWWREPGIEEIRFIASPVAIEPLFHPVDVLGRGATEVVLPKGCWRTTVRVTSTRE